MARSGEEERVGNRENSLLRWRRTLGSKAKSAGEEKNIASTMRRITRIEITKTQPIHSCPGAAKAPSARKASSNQ